MARPLRGPSPRVRVQCGPHSGTRGATLGANGTVDLARPGRAAPIEIGQPVRMGRDRRRTVHSDLAHPSGRVRRDVNWIALVTAIGFIWVLRPRRRTAMSSATSASSGVGTVRGSPRALDDVPPSDVPMNVGREDRAKQGHSLTPAALTLAALTGLLLSIAAWRAATRPPPAVAPSPGALLLVTSNHTVDAELSFHIDEPFSSEPMMGVGLALRFPEGTASVGWALLIDERLVASEQYCPQERLNVQVVDALICADLPNRGDIVAVGRTTVTESYGELRAIAVQGSTECCSRLFVDRTIRITLFVALRGAAASRSGAVTTISGPRVTRRVLARTPAIGPAVDDYQVLSNPLVDTMSTSDEFEYRASVTNMPYAGNRRVASSGLQELAADGDRVEFQLHEGAALAATVVDLDRERRDSQFAAASLLTAGLFLGLLAQEISTYAHRAKSADE